MPISDLTGTKWVLQNSFTNPNTTFYLNFVSNAINYSGLYGVAGGNGSFIYYGRQQGDTLVWQSSSSGTQGWQNQAYRLISITGGTDATNATLISWLESNATQVPVVDLTGTEWVFNSNVYVYNDDGSPYGGFYINFTSNGNSYGTIEFTLTSDGPSYQDLVNTLKYDTSAVYGPVQSPVPVPIPQASWVQEEYKTISISSGSDVTNPSLIEVLSRNAVYQEPQLSVDLTTLSGWSSVSAGSHTLKVKAKATGYRDSALSSGASFTKSSLPTPKSNLSFYTWAEVKQLADALAAGTIDAATLSSTYHVAIGSTKSATINNEQHDYRLIGINHDVDANDNTLGMTFEQVDLMLNTYEMKALASQTSSDSWQNSDLKTTLEGFTVYDSLAAVITPAKKVCAKNVSSGTPTYNYVNTVNGLWIESETEVAGTQAHTIGSTIEGAQYLYYINGESRVKQKSGINAYWWLRSPQYWNRVYNQSFFAHISSGGGIQDGGANGSESIAPCFCI